MSRETFLKKIDGVYQVVHEVEQTDADLQYIQHKKEMQDILLRLQDIDIKRFKFIDGALTVDEYEPFKQEAITLRLRYNELETLVVGYEPQGTIFEYQAPEPEPIVEEVVEEVVEEQPHDFTYEEIEQAAEIPDQVVEEPTAEEVVEEPIQEEQVVTETEETV